jgi:hypothetical protein
MRGEAAEQSSPANADASRRGPSFARRMSHPFEAGVAIDGSDGKRGEEPQNVRMTRQVMGLQELRQLLRLLPERTPLLDEPRQSRRENPGRREASVGILRQAGEHHIFNLGGRRVARAFRRERPDDRKGAP